MAQIQQEPAGNYHSVADCRNKANKSLQKTSHVQLVCTIQYILVYNLQIRRNRGGDKGYGGEIVPPVPHISGDLDAKHVPSNDLYYCYHSFQVIRPSTVSDYIHSLHSLHMYICRESMDRTKIFVRQRRHTTLKMKRLNFITLLPPCLLESLAVGCSTSFLTKEN